MRKVLATLGLAGLLALSSCGDNKDKYIGFVQKNRPAKWYVLHQEIDKSTLFFDRDGDGTIDEILKVNVYLRNSLGDIDMIPKERAEYFVAEGTNQDQQVIGRVEPQPLSQEERESASQLTQLFYNKNE